MLMAAHHFMIPEQHLHDLQKPQMMQQAQIYLHLHP